MSDRSETEKARRGSLRAFRHFNFRLFWGGQLISLIGTWMQSLAQSWLILVLADPYMRQQVFSHGGDAAAVAHASTPPAIQHLANWYSGLVNFAGGIPLLLFMLFAGVIIDRVNKRRLLIGTQFGISMCALVLGLLVHFGVVTLNEVILVAFALGTVMSFDMPARQSFVVEMVGRQDLPSAVGLNSSMFNSARALGPAVAGLMLSAHVSLADCFFANSVSYIPVICGLMLMRGKNLGAPVAIPEDEEGKVWDRLKEGFAFVRDNHTARNLVILVGSFGTFAFSFNVLIPTFVRYTLLPHATNAEQVRTFGFMETVRGIGALCGAISVTAFASTDRQKSMLIGGSLLATSVLIVFGFAREMWLAYATMAIVSFAFVLCFATSNTWMQVIVPDALRGRVMSIYTMMFIGTGPIGAVLAGYIAGFFGAPPTIVFFAVVTFAITLLVCFRPGGLRDLEMLTSYAHVVPHREVTQSRD